MECKDVLLLEDKWLLIIFTYVHVATVLTYTTLLYFVPIVPRTARGSVYTITVKYIYSIFIAFKIEKLKHTMFGGTVTYFPQSDAYITLQFQRISTNK